MQDEHTDRLGLPLLWAGQAQKELFHNEALTLIDIGVQASVVAVGVSDPPSDPQHGACWIVGPLGRGAWEGQDQALAGWTGGGWRFIAAREGMMVWSKADGMTARYRSGQWQVGEVTARSVSIGGYQVLGEREAAILDPVGGEIVDGEAREALKSVLLALRAHGLIAAE
tara:strand:+ start:492 stop:998 length:507 start_codon:yes stop_codon:yes gene_type:complete